MKKIHHTHSDKGDSTSTNSDTNVVESSAEQIPSARTPKRRRGCTVRYEEGDLRGLVAEALAKSKDPYRALLEADVIKDAAEFFDAIS
jgi:hypothetical protein